MLVASMTNFGVPYIVVEDGDYPKNRELYLRHSFEVRNWISNMQKIFRSARSVGQACSHRDSGRSKKLLSYDGEKNSQTFI